MIPGSERQWIIILLKIKDATSFRYKRECSLTGSTGLANTLESSQTIYTLTPIGRKEILWLTPSNVVRKLRALQALSKYYRIVRSLKKLSKRNKISKQGTMPTWRNRCAQSTRTLLPRLTASVSNWLVRQNLIDVGCVVFSPRCKWQNDTPPARPAREPTASCL